jgi:hypothetical protein
VLEDPIAEAICNSGQQAFDLIGSKLDNFARANIDQVIVMLVGGYFESRSAGAKIELFNDSNSAQHVNDPVDGR